MKRVLIFDTSILCVWLEVPGMEQCGAANDRWNKPRIDAKINAELKNQQTTLVLPLASIIETGNHIAKAPHSNYARANALAELIRKSADAQTPWAAFSDQSTLWSQKQLKALADSWPTLATQKLSLGDVTIKEVAEFYANVGCCVEILTGDNGLKAYEPIIPIEKPRRRN